MSEKNLGTITVKLKAMTAEFGKSLSKARVRLEKFSKTSKKIAKGAGIAFAGMSVPIGYAIKVASDMDEQMNVLRTSFGKMTPEVLKWSRETSRSVGRSEMQMRNFAGSLQAMLTPMMGSQEAAAGLSVKLSALAVDLGSFYNVADDESLIALRAGLIGSIEPMMKFGVVMTQANLQAFALSRGIQKSVQKMTEAEKVSLRYAFIMDRTKTAQGDAAKTASGFANTMKAVQGEVINLAGEVGMLLLPLATKLATGMKKVLQWFRDLSPELKKSIVLVGVLTTGFTGLAVGIGVVGAALPSVVDGFITMGKGIAAATKLAWGLRAVLLKVVAIAGAVTGVVGMANLMAEALADPKGLRERLGVEGKDVGIFDAIKIVYKEAFVGGFDATFGPIGDALNAVMDKVGKALEPEKVEDSSKAIAKAFDDLTKDIKIAGQRVKRGFDFEDFPTDELAAEIGEIARAGAFGFDFDKMHMPDDVRQDFENAQREISEAIKPQADFKDAMNTAYTDVRESLGTFSELARAAEEGGKSGGVWGAIVAVVVRILQMTQIFQKIVGHFNMVVNTMVMALDRMLAPLAPLIELLSNGLIVLANFTIAISELSFGIEFITKAVGWVADGLTKALDWIIEKWNNLVDGLAKILGKIPGIGGKLKSMAEKLTLDYSGQARADYESMFGDGGPDFSGFADGMSTATEAVKEFGESMTNVPQGYKVSLARFNAMDPETGPMATGPQQPALAAAFAGPGLSRTVNNEIHIHGITEPEELYAELRRIEETDAFVSGGTPIRGGTPYSVSQPK